MFDNVPFAASYPLYNSRTLGMSDSATSDLCAGAASEPDGIRGAFYATGVSAAKQWCHVTLGMPDAWAAGTGGDGVLLGVLDSGISLDHEGNLTHPDLRDPRRFQLGTDYIDPDRKPRDVTGHGTAMTGIVTGINWGSPVRICRVLNHRNECSVSSLGPAIREIVREGRNHGRKIVINYSAGGYTLSRDLLDAVSSAADSDVLLCCPTGNDWLRVAYPAALSDSIPGILAVGSTDREDKVALRTGRGPEVTFVAPGVDIHHPFPTYRVAGQLNAKLYSSSCGTSAATAIVSGLVSLVWSLRPTLTNVQVKQVLIDTARKLIPGLVRHSDWGFGRVDAAAAVRKVLSL
jgi:subtilisin family serine protease